MKFPRQTPAGSSPARDAALRRLGRNLHRYAGETIEIDAVLADFDRAATGHGWTREEILAGADLRVPLWHRPAPRPARRIYLSTGIHGDEPAGPLAMSQLVRDNDWPEGAEYWVLPCLNPTGFPLNSRENAAGQDLNRDYRHPRSAEVRAHIAWLARAPRFDLALLLHEDWEAHGFYVYELNPTGLPSLAEPMVDAVVAVCPIDRSDLIEGRPAHGGIIRPNQDLESRPDWPEAFYLNHAKTSLNYTLEAPSDFPLSVRVTALVTAVNAGLRAFL